jgi:hypothetical protein
VTGPHGEFVADTLLTVLATEPDLPLTLGLFFSEVKSRCVATREVSGHGYARQPLRLVRSGRWHRKNANPVRFVSTGPWGMVSHLGVFDPDGRQLLHKSLGAVVPVDREEIFFQPGDITLYVGDNRVVGAGK